MYVLTDVLHHWDKVTKPEGGVLLPLLNLHFVERAGKPDFRPGFRGSALGKLCAREEVFKKLLPRYPKPVSTRVQAIFEIGHAVHHRWQNYVLGPAGLLEGWWHCRTCDFKVEGIMPGDICPECKSLRRCGSCKTKLKHDIYIEDHKCKSCKSESWEYEEYELLYTALDIVGHCDGVVLINGKRYIWEFKTINDNGFVNRITHSAIKEHVWQVQIYMWLKKLEEAIIHYINKDTGEQKEFLVKYNDNYRKTITRRIESVWRHQKSGVLPDDKACNSRSVWRAKACPWVRECFSYKIFKKALEEEGVQTPALEVSNE